MFDRDGFEGATVAAIRSRARASNGSFFHFFGSKKELAGTLFLEVLQRYHAAVLAAIAAPCGAREGIDRLIRAHLDWVVNNRREARYLFEISRSEWTEAVRDAQRAQNSRLGEGVERWRAPLIASGELLPMTPTLFFSQIIGPAQIFCRAWLSGRDRTDPRLQADILIACAIRALVAPHPSQTPEAILTEQAMTQDADFKPDPDFAPIAQRIRDSVGQQGFMGHVGAELSELARGSCTLAVDRRPELLQQHGLFHGGVTAFLVDNATTIAAATSRGQPVLTAEYKLNLLSPASGERLICRARVIKPGRQVAVVAADVFCVIDGVEKHTATALASIAMLPGEVTAQIPSPA